MPDIALARKKPPLPLSPSFLSAEATGRRTRNPSRARNKERSDPRPATMAAVRCAARRLGGSLLQRTQAEGRLVPSRLMRSRGLSSEHAHEIQQKKEALFDAVAKAEQMMQELRDALSKAGESTDVLLSAEAAPGVTPELTGAQRRLQYTKRVREVLDAAAKFTFYVFLTTAVVGIGRNKGVAHAQAPAKEGSK